MSRLTKITDEKGKTEYVIEEVSGRDCCGNTTYYPTAKFDSFEEVITYLVTGQKLNIQNLQNIN